MQRNVPTRASKVDPFASAQDLAVQSQPLFNVKDSNKVCFCSGNNLLIFLSYFLKELFYDFAYMQEERERLIIRRFKFEEPRPEQIQELEVCILNDLILKFLFWNLSYLILFDQ